MKKRKDMMKSVRNGTIRKHNLSSTRYTFNEDAHLFGFRRMLKTKNYTYILECEGKID